MFLVQSKGGKKMKRRLALLLALTLTFASFPVAGAAAAEAEPVETQVVTEVSEENEMVPAEETVQADEEEEAAAGESVQEDASEAEQGEDQEEAAEAAEGAEEGETAEAAGEGMTDEVAPVEEPAEGTTEEAAVVDETLIEEEAKKAEEAKNGFVVENGATYYYINNVMQTGLISISGVGTFYFMDPSYIAYQASKKGQMLTGWKTVDGIVRYFADEKYTAASVKTGKMLTGWKVIGGKTYYLDKSTGEQYQGWRTIDGYKYFFNDGSYSGAGKGQMLTGFKIVNGVSYYFADYRCKSLPTGARATGWKKINGNTYYFKDSKYTGKGEYGQMLTGAKYIAGKAYYFNKGGVMQTGWVKTTAGVMAYYTSTGASTGKAGWKQNGSAWYYLNANGMAKTGWLTLNSSSIYYLDKDKAGKMTVGPKKFPNGKIYFFDDDGRRAVKAGWRYYNGYYYYANASGTTAANKTVEGIKLDEWGRTKMSTMDMKAQGYSSDTNYLILVDKATHKVCVYKGSKGKWTRIKGEWLCTHGGSSTPVGSFKIDAKASKHGAEYGWLDWTETSAAFCSGLSAGNFIHSILYEKYSRSNPYYLDPVDDTLGASYSRSCIRLKTENAEWVFRNVPVNTRVVVYN